MKKIPYAPFLLLFFFTGTFVAYVATRETSSKVKLTDRQLLSVKVFEDTKAPGELTIQVIKGTTFREHEAQVTDDGDIMIKGNEVTYDAMLRAAIKEAIRK